MLIRGALTPANLFVCDKCHINIFVSYMNAFRFLYMCVQLVSNINCSGADCSNIRLESGRSCAAVGRPLADKQHPKQRALAQWRLWLLTGASRSRWPAWPQIAGVRAPQNENMAVTQRCQSLLSDVSHVRWAMLRLCPRFKGQATPRPTNPPTPPPKRHMQPQMESQATIYRSSIRQHQTDVSWLRRCGSGGWILSGIILSITKKTIVPKGRKWRVVRFRGEHWQTAAAVNWPLTWQWRHSTSRSALWEWQTKCHRFISLPLTVVHCGVKGRNKNWQRLHCWGKSALFCFCTPRLTEN